MKSVQIDVKKIDLFIDGEYVESSNGSTFEVKNPATQEIIAHVSEASEEDVDRACRVARQAFEEGPWRTMSVAERSTKIRTNG